MGGLITKLSQKLLYNSILAAYPSLSISAFSTTRIALFHITRRSPVLRSKVMFSAQPRQMRMRRTGQPLPCPTVHAHNGLFPREGGQSSKLVAQVSRVCVCVCRVVRMFEWTGEGWVRVCYRPSGRTIMAHIAARTPITVWLVLASVTAIKTKRRLESKRGFYSGSIVTVRLLGVYFLFSYSVHVA